MNNRFMIKIFALLFIFLSSLIFAQDDKKYTIGLSTWTGYPQSVKGFKDGLASEGLIEGQNVVFLKGIDSNDKEKQKQVALEYKAKKVDLVYSLTTPNTIIVKENLPETIPIVFSIVTYPADSGLIESFDYSANNLVGTSNYVPLKNYIKLLKLIVPNTKKVAIFHRKGEPNSKIQASNMFRLLRREGIKVINIEPSNLDELKVMANDIVNEVDLFMTTTDTLMQSGGEDILINISLEKKIPILSSNKTGIEKGSSFGPVSDFYTLGKISGKKAAMILLDGVLPTQLESELQNPPVFLVNKKSIESLGIKLSKEVLRQVKITK